ncbi:MAG: RnfABCDGE type electron transport complex subunit G, partial [Bacillota bacterium]
EVFRLGVVLLVICAVAAAVLAAVDGITSDRIAAQTAARVQQALKHVLPEADEFKDATEVLLQVKAETSAQGKPFLAIVDRMYIGYSQDEQRGFVFICLPSGYGGVIETAVGVSSDGNVRGVSIIRHSETPGLGSQITGSDFLERFVGVSAGTHVGVEKDGGQIDSVTGATVSSRAVANAVNQALEVFEALNGIEDETDAVTSAAGSSEAVESGEDEVLGESEAVTDEEEPTDAVTGATSHE